MYSCKILADSLSIHGVRLTTFEITYPRMVHSELMTHRMFSRNSASSRAIPLRTMIKNVQNDPVMPVYWGKNQSGMQAQEELTGHDRDIAEKMWLGARDEAIKHAEWLDLAHVHKQIANRILEPWMWITVIVSATDWANFFHLRCHPHAQPEIQKIAYMMKDLYLANDPAVLQPGEWHLPLTTPDDILECKQRAGNEVGATHIIKMVSAGRCARVSYLTHDGRRDLSADIDLCHRLIESGHWSPLEHVATPLLLSTDSSFSNFRGWLQFRKEYSGLENYTGAIQ